jgi:hypothetical protein
VTVAVAVADKPSRDVFSLPQVRPLYQRWRQLNGVAGCAELGGQADTSADETPIEQNRRYRAIARLDGAGSLASGETAAYLSILTTLEFQ